MVGIILVMESVRRCWIEVGSLLLLGHPTHDIEQLLLALISPRDEGAHKFEWRPEDG